MFLRSVGWVFSFWPFSDPVHGFQGPDWIDRVPCGLTADGLLRFLWLNFSGANYGKQECLKMINEAKCEIERFGVQMLENIKLMEPFV